MTEGSTTAARPACPFPGLRPFWREEAELFFGRDQEIADLRRALLGERRFVAVIGTSGCGKSSLVEAGLLPRLLTEGASGGRPWRIASLRPLGAPVAQLAEALAAFAKAEQPETFGRLHATVLASRFRATLRRTTDGLVDAVREVLADSSAPVLVFVDQFEELFRYEPDEPEEDLPLFRDEAQIFANLLLGATRAAAPAIHVLVTMRSDFFGECGRYRGLAEAVSASQFLVPRMVREQLQEAITGPLCVATGIPRGRWPEVLEPALLQRLLNAVGDEATADPLPVMQHALMRAWQMAERGGERAAPLLRVADYVAAGEVAEALSRHADELLERATAAADPALPPDGVAHLFRALTDIDREGRAVRRPQTLAELAPVVGAPVAALRPVLDAFRAPGVSFLTPYSPAPVGEATPVDISHEALIRRWRRIADQSVDAETGQPRGWVQQEFWDGLTWRALAVQAEAFDRNPEACLDPVTTGQRYPWFRNLRRRPGWALRYAIRPERRTAPDAAPEWLAVRELLLHSLRRKRDERRAQRAAQGERLHAARMEAAAAAAAQRARWTRRVAVVVIVLGIGAVLAGAYGLQQRRDAAAAQALAEHQGARAEAEAAAVAEITRAAEAERLARDLAEQAQARAEGEAAAAEAARRAAEGERARAETGFAAARQATNGLVFDLAQGLRTRAGVSAETVQLLLGRADAVLDRMIALAPDDADLLQLKMVALNEFATTYATLGDTARQRAAAEESLAIAERLAARDGGNTGWQRDLSTSHERVGDVRVAQGDLAGALAAYQAGLAIRERLAALDPGNTEWQRDLSVSHNQIGDVRRAQGDLAGALAAYQAGLVIAERLAARDAGNTEWQRRLSVSHERVGDVRGAQDDLAGALAAYQAGLAIRERLAALDPDNTEWQRDLSVSHERIGDVQVAQDDLAGALAAYQAGLAIRERLAALDPGNTEWQRDLSISHIKVGDVRGAQDDLAGALAAYQAGLVIAERLAARDAGNTGWQRDLSISHERIGDVRAAQGDLAGALAAYQAGLAIAKRLAARDAGNTGWQRDLLVFRFKIGDALLRLGAVRGARRSAEAALGIARDRASRFPDHADSARDLRAAEGLMRRIEAAAEAKAQ